MNCGCDGFEIFAIKRSMESIISLATYATSISGCSSWGPLDPKFWGGAESMEKSDS